MRRTEVKPKTRCKQEENSANFDYEAESLSAIGPLGRNLSAAEHKHVVFGLIFLAYLSSFVKHANSEWQEGVYADNPDKYRTSSIWLISSTARFLI